MALQTANIIGSGPNGLAAAITLAQRGVAVTVYERSATPGGACTTAEVTLPGFQHDLGASAFPLGIASPFFRSLPLERYGLRWIQPAAAIAHPLDDGTALTLEASLEATAAQLTAHDASAWRQLLAPTVRHWNDLLEDFLRPLLSVPHHPLAMARFGLPALLPARLLARTAFQDERTRALFAGNAAHSVIPLTHLASAAPGLVLAAAAHSTGWPIAAGGAGSITAALIAHLTVLGGRIVCSAEVDDLRALPAADVTIFDTSVGAMERIAGAALAPQYVQSLRRFRPGPAAFKIDYALSAPIPWRAAACLRAATVHVGGSLDEIARSEHDAFYGRRNDHPFVLVVQPSLFDPTRAPAGQHTAWAYCHTPTGSVEDCTPAIEAQLERFAPGFRDCVLARRASNSAALAAWDPNLVGGDLSGGAMTLLQLLSRPTAKLYRTSHPQLYIGSSSTPPGGGVHGMCGHQAALAALHDHR
jgi:phytoene dehydrogenase-like protein